MNMEAFIEQIKFRYSKINPEIIKGKIKEYKSLDPEIKKKLIEKKELSSYSRYFDNIVFSRQINEIIYNINIKNELYSIGYFLLEILRDLEDGNKFEEEYENLSENEDFDESKEIIKKPNRLEERIKKIKEEKLQNLVESLLKKNIEERIKWEEYINHPFFKENKENKLYIYSKKKCLNLGKYNISNIIILNDKRLLVRAVPDNIFIIEQNYNKYFPFLKNEGKYLFNLKDNSILIDDLYNKKILIYKINDNKPLLEQTIDIDYSVILVLSNTSKDIVISTKDKFITIWKKENNDYQKSLSLKTDYNNFYLYEIKPKNEILAYYLEKSNHYSLFNFYEKEKMELKGNIDLKGANLKTVFLINNKILGYSDSSYYITLVDINIYNIIINILIGNSPYSSLVTNSGRILFGIVEINYNTDDENKNFLKEYSFENNNLICKKIVNLIAPITLTEIDNKFLAIGTIDGKIYIFE